MRNMCSMKTVVGIAIGIYLVLSPALARAQTTVTTPGGTSGYIPKFTGTSTIAKSILFDTGTTIGIGVGATPNSSVKLDIGGGMIVRGNTIVARTGSATASKAYPSWGFQFFANAYNSSTRAGDNPYFTLQSEPTGNNTASPSATFNLLFSNNGAASAETGFYINPDGTLHFASGQTFPIAAGPQGPAGPTGPQGPAGPQGPPGSGGALTLPYSAAQDGGGNTLFSITNTGTAYGTGIKGAGADAPPGTTFGSGGVGVVAQGGESSAQSGVKSFGGVGIRGIGGAAQNDGGGSGGDGGNFQGGSASPGTFGGNGLEAYGGSATETGHGGPGIYAQAGESTGSAAIFQGNVQVNGNLAKSGGSFKIDNPLDPANRYLSHSFVESPDMMNIYNGNVVTDGRGEANVTLPDYFEALNRDFRYQLTTIGQPAQAYIAAEIANGVFVIKTDKAGVKVSWQVTGVRQDAWANAHRIPVDEEKPAKERGHFTHPELFGHAGEASISEMGHSRPGLSEQH